VDVESVDPVAVPRHCHRSPLPTRSATRPTSSTGACFPSAHPMRRSFRSTRASHAVCAQQRALTERRGGALAVMRGKGDAAAQQRGKWSRRGNAHPRTTGGTGSATRVRSYPPNAFNPVMACPNPACGRRACLRKCTRFQVRHMAHGRVIRKDAVGAQEPPRLARRSPWPCRRCSAWPVNLLRRHRALVLQASQLHTQQLRLGDLRQHFRQPQLLQLEIRRWGLSNMTRCLA